MTTGTGDSFPTTMNIEKISDVEGRDGLQWELQVKWPWTNKYPDKVWLDQGGEKPTVGAHNVQVHKTGYKKKEDQTYYDGNQGWMFNYKVDSFGGEGHQASPNGHTGAPASRDDIFRTKEELRWTEALHMASTLTGFEWEDPVMRAIEMAERLYQALEAGYPHLAASTPQVSTETVPEHYCGEHQEPHYQGPAHADGSPGRWGHRLGMDAWCMEG